ncbi:MAG: alternative ribosome rescue aminoacyl-tRNA hydrolase ArfB [Acidobacteriota bacterium]
MTGHNQVQDSTGRLVVTRRLSLEGKEIRESFIRSAGPGGQNVNKVATAVQLRFDAAHSPSLPAGVFPRLARLAGRRMTREGVLVITARRYRTRERNRIDARQRLADLVRRALVRPVRRRKTVPTAAGRRRRLQDKARRSLLKAQRRAVDGNGD